jgi:alpha-ketoglutarate-dependent taurine dioxygenase
MRQLLEDVNARGWAPFEGVGLLDVARHFGTPVPGRANRGLVDELRVLDRDDAARRSLSALFGTGPLPFHTDTAHWTSPARYVVIQAVRPGLDPRSTTLLTREALALTDDQSETLRRGVFRVEDGRRSFLTNALSDTWVRFDAGCMSPANATGAEAARILQERIGQGGAIEISWRAGAGVVFDNWRCLHAREGAGPTDRVLRRVLVK